MLESAAICVEDRRRHLLRHLTPALQFCVVSSFLPAPLSCLGPLDLSPRSSGLSSSAGSGGCSSCALLCASQGCMSACWTEPAANPGGPREGLRQGDVRGGGWTEAEPSRLRNQMLRGFSRYPARTFSAHERTHGDTHTETRIQNQLQITSAPPYNHMYKQTIMRTIKPQLM